MYLKLEYVPDAVDTNKHQIFSFVIIFIEEFYEDIQSTSTNKHLQS